MQTPATLGLLDLLVGPAQAGLCAVTGWIRSAVSTGPWAEAGPAGHAASTPGSFQKASPVAQFSALFTHCSHPRMTVKGPRLDLEGVDLAHGYTPSLCAQLEMQHFDRPPEP